MFQLEDDGTGRSNITAIKAVYDSHLILRYAQDDKVQLGPSNTHTLAGCSTQGDKVNMAL